MQAKVTGLGWCVVVALWALVAPARAYAQSPLAEQPVILIPGWGPEALTSYRHFVGYLTASGTPAERIHVLRYDYLGSLARIDEQLTAQITEVLRLYDESTRFVFVGHSTGQFVGLAAIMHNHWDARVAKFIGLAGIAHGWDCAACRVGLLGVGQTHLAPVDSPYLRQFWARYQDRVGALPTCSVFSPEDGLIRPFDSGRLPGGINIEVRDVPHLDEIKSPAVFAAVATGCFPPG